MNKGKITKTEYELIKHYAQETTKYVFFEEEDDYVNMYFTNHEELATKISADIILNNIRNRENKLLRITIDEVLNQVCERMYNY